MSTACEEGDLGNWGRPGAGGGSFNIIYRVVTGSGVGEGRTTVEAG
jgi:hypothetical protein